MFKKVKDTYTFFSDSKKYESFFAQDGAIEIYEADDPAKTGFIFPDQKAFFSFINNLTDIAKTKQEK